MHIKAQQVLFLHMTMITMMMESVLHLRPSCASRKHCKQASACFLKNLQFWHPHLSNETKYFKRFSVLFYSSLCYFNGLHFQLHVVKAVHLRVELHPDSDRRSDVYHYDPECRILDKHSRSRLNPPGSRTRWAHTAMRCHY